VDLIEQLLHLGPRLAFDTFGQERGGSFRDAATGAEEADVFDDLPVQRQEELQLVAAERVVALAERVAPLSS